MKPLVLFKLTLLYTLFSLSSFAQRIARVEPPNWWVGMQHNEIQLLVYGDNIGDLKASITSDAVELVSQIVVENTNYLFLNLRIANTAKAGNVAIDFFDGKRRKLTHTYPLLTRDSSLSRKGFDNSDVMYLITPDRFANGDPSNDVVAGMKEKVVDRSDDLGRHGGDLKGIEDHLDYIKEVGFTAIWLNPVLENDMYRTSYHGYAATDFYKVDARFGTNEDYRRLCAKAQEKGIKIIMDMILNHSGSEHWFVLDPPTNDWINNNNTYVQTSHRRTTHQDPYASAYDKKAFVDGWFVKTMPDLNQNQPQMATYLIQNTLWWIEYSGITGIRMDTYPYPDKEYMRRWNDAILKEYPEFNVVGEEWSYNPAIVSFWQRGKVNSSGYTSSLPSVMDFPIQNAVVQALVEEENWNTGWIKAYEMLGNDHLYPDPFNLVIFPDNHDMDRIYTQLGKDTDLLKMAMIYFATMRGIPQFYYGTEIGMKNDRPGHGQIRSDFPGGWPNDTINGFTGEGLTPTEKEIKAFTTTLLNWRKNTPVIHSGKLMQFAPAEGVYSYFRYDDDQLVMVVFNKNDKTVAHDLGKYGELLGNRTQAIEMFKDTPVDLTKPLSLPPRSGMIYLIN